MSSVPVFHRYISGWSATTTDLVYASHFLPQLIMRHNTHMPQPLCLHCWGLVFPLLSFCVRAGVSHFLGLNSGYASKNKNPAFNRTYPSMTESALLSKCTTTHETTLWSTQCSHVASAELNSSACISIVKHNLDIPLLIQTHDLEQACFKYWNFALENSFFVSWDCAFEDSPHHY